jgi:hypothetical protein
LPPIPVRAVIPQLGGRPFERACWAAARAAVAPLGDSPEAIARELGGDDGAVAALILRAAVTGAVVTDPSWMGSLVTNGTSHFLMGLSPLSAMAAVIAAGTIVPLGEYGSLTLPYRLPVPIGGWLAEAGPIPITAPLTLSTATLAPKKAGILLVFSKELAWFADGEAVFTTMLRSSAAATIDSLYLSAAAGSASALPGLLNGVAATTTTGSAAGDLAALARACQGTDGSGRVIYIAGPALAADASTRYDIRAGTTILASTAVQAGRLIAIDPSGVIHSVSPTPMIDASEEAVLVMDTAPPALIGTPGTPPVVSAPTQSMFQTSQISLRLLLDLGWTKWRSDCVSFMDGVAW